jgi:type VI secretion system protein ImpG
MNREFLDIFNQELGLLKEQAKEFAEDYPGIAARLGGLIEDRPDNMILGLLEGAAYLAARVQLKLKHEFPEFSNNLLEQLVPHYLAPTPSVLMARIVPPFGDPALRESRIIPRGAYLDANYRERDRKVACRYRLTTDVTLWPFDIVEAEYLTTPAPLQALGLDVGPEVQSGLRLHVTFRGAPDAASEVDAATALKQPEKLIAGCRIKDLPMYFLGDEADAVALYEMFIANCSDVFVRSLDSFGNPLRPVPRLPANSLAQLGFSDDEALLPNDDRMFGGFDLMREYFMFPRKFLGIRVGNLDTQLRSLRAKSFDLVFVFRTVNPRLSAVVRPDRFALYASPAINLFTMDMDRIPVKANQHEYHVVPDRSRTLDFEPHQILDVNAHYPGGQTKVRVPPLYSTAPDGTAYAQNLFYSLRRLPRRRTIEEKKYGVTSDYVGTDVFLSLIEPAGIVDEARVTELSVRALCSNRHLTEHLPVGEGRSDFQLRDNTELKIFCVDGPTSPREPVLSHLRSRSETAHTGVVAWRLINMLALNHLGLVERGGGRNGQAVRDILSMFADMGDSTMEKRIRGLRSVDSRPIVRRIRRAAGVGAARGIEITVTLDDRAFEGSGVFLLGAILDRFFAEYAAVNSFTQTVIRTAEWGELFRWPARLGLRGLL